MGIESGINEGLEKAKADRKAARGRIVILLSKSKLVHAMTFAEIDELVKCLSALEEAAGVYGALLAVQSIAVKSPS